MTQNVEDFALSPQCASGQHEACLQKVSYMADDGVGRTMVCPCRCHERAPTAGREPETVYRISWEYEVVQPAANEGEEEPRAWVRRRVLTVDKGVAGDWLDAITELAKQNRVRHVDMFKSPVEWEKVG